MRRGSRGYALVLSLFGIALFVSGCSNDTADDQNVSKNTVQETAEIETVTESSSSSGDMASLLQDVKKITIISMDGSEINVELDPFITDIQDLLPTLQKSDKTLSTFDYTVVFWNQQDDPVVMQVGENGVKLGDTYYTGSTVTLLMDLVENYAGNHFFDNLQIDRIMISARDLGQTKQFSGEDVRVITQSLQNARFIQEPPRIQDPLYPYYVLELDVGGKQIIEVELISPTLLSVDLGEKRSYYQLKESLYGPLKKQIPLMDYSPGHIKYLFKSSEIKLIDMAEMLPKAEILVGGEGTDPLEVRSITHFFVRLLSTGEPADINLNKNSPSMMLQFKINDTIIPVAVYPDGFIYKNQAYEREGIQQAIVDRVMENFKN
ncbi:MAG: hypothetical protein H0Z33_03970 [Bacillaceae bacterium]|nr:hypothetical protein [Bacillaceae bacterium]